MTQEELDAIDARRWRALKKRHAVALCRIATGNVSFSSIKAPALLDAWADMAVAEIEAFDHEHWINVEVPARISELQKELSQEEPGA